MKKILILLAVLALTSCSALYQSGQGTGSQSAQTSGSTAATGSITSVKGYRPTDEDVNRYKNSISAFLNANVPNFNRFQSAMILVNDVEVDNLDKVTLDKVHLISVLDSSSAVILGTSSRDGVIIIKTK